MGIFDIILHPTKTKTQPSGPDTKGWHFRQWTGGRVELIQPHFSASQWHQSPRCGETRTSLALGRQARLAAVCVRAVRSLPTLASISVPTAHSQRHKLNADVMSVSHRHADVMSVIANNGPPPLPDRVNNKVTR
ncbi:hypothetical protein BaRGS_00029288 [Batillaria attramentaria]|uniref:Uncharacterized protein n=1 Tax=Batillaria attramentaria TaxID=370345 RepID=A0ABD0JWV5_9CAEN